MSGLLDWLEGVASWLKSLVMGEFDTHRPMSAVLADMAISLVPGVVIATSSRDMVAVLLRIGDDLKAGRRVPVMDWIILVASALPLALIAVTALAAGVGAIAGDELGAALRAVAVTLAKIIAGEFKSGAEAIQALIRGLGRLMRGDPVAWLRLVKFSTYKAGVLKACRNMITNALGKIRWCRGKLEWIFGTSAMIRRLDEAASALEHISGALERGIGQAIEELDRALQKLLNEIHPAPSRPAHVGVPAPKPKVVKPRRVKVTSGIRAKPRVVTSAARDAGEASHVASGASKGAAVDGDAAKAAPKAADEGPKVGGPAPDKNEAPGTGADSTDSGLPSAPSSDKGTNVHEPPLPPGATEKISNFQAKRAGGLNMRNLSPEDAAAQKQMKEAGWSREMQKQVLNSGDDFHMQQGHVGDPMYGFSSPDYAKGDDSAYWMDEATFQDMQSKYQDPATGEWNSAGVKNELALPCYNQANTVYSGTLTQDQTMVASTINPATETVTQVAADGSTITEFSRSMPGGGSQVTPALGTVGNITKVAGQ